MKAWKQMGTNIQQVGVWWGNTFVGGEFGISILSTQELHQA